MVKPAINKRFKSTRRVSAVLPAAARKVFREYGFAEDALIRRWQEIIGQKFADLTLPLKLTYGKEKGERVATLHLLVESGAALEVQHQIPLLIEKLNIFYGYQEIGRIALIQGGPKTIKKPKKAKTTLPDPAAVKQMELWTKAMKDSGLKETLIRLGVEVLSTEQK